MRKCETSSDGETIFRGILEIHGVNIRTRFAWLVLKATSCVLRTGNVLWVPKIERIFKISNPTTGFS